MPKTIWLLILFVLSILTVSAGERPYIGYVYPAGGQQDTTFQAKIGGQGLDDVNQAIVSGIGVRAKVLEYFKRLGPNEVTLLNEQLKELRQLKSAAAKTKPAASTLVTAASNTAIPPTASQDDPVAKMISQIEKRLAQSVNNPACNSISNLVYVEITVSIDAEAGPREIRLVTPRGGASNPLVFFVGQLPEVIRKPMLSASLQILGKEELALRKRPIDEVEQKITVPCTVNGQIASGEVNRYRFEAQKGQRLVLTTEARSLVPFIADAVPGWFQPVLAMYDAAGKEVAYDDDYRFKPDPVILFEIPKSGEYVFTINDGIYRGREDFVYRVTIGELPFITSIFPLGAPVGRSSAIEMKGWNLDQTLLTPPAKDAALGVHFLAAHRGSVYSNIMPFALDNLPECVEKEPNNDRSTAQKVALPIIINGRIDKPGDWDVFQFSGKAGQIIVAEVSARRLDSPLDSELKITDPAGKLLAFNDDHEDLGSGVNTHNADSYIRVKLPDDGTYCVHLGDTAKNGGEEYGYRLRISEPRPDFELRLVPSSLAIRQQSTAGVDVRVIRKDGFNGPIKLNLKDPPEGFSAVPVTLAPNQDVIRINLKTTLNSTKRPISLTVVGVATIGSEEVAHQAVPTEDRMQAFLWRHLVPAQDFKVTVFDPNVEPPPKRVSHISAAAIKANVAAATSSTEKPKFSKQQVAGRLKQLKYLFEENLLSDEFYARKIAECEAAQ